MNDFENAVLDSLEAIRLAILSTDNTSGNNERGVASDKVAREIEKLREEDEKPKAPTAAQTRAAREKREAEAEAREEKAAEKAKADKEDESENPPVTPTPTSTTTYPPVGTPGSTMNPTTPYSPPGGSNFPR